MSKVKGSHHVDAPSLARRLRREIAGAGLSLTTVAESMGRHRTFVSNVLNRLESGRQSHKKTIAAVRLAIAKQTPKTKTPKAKRATMVTPAMALAVVPDIAASVEPVETDVSTVAGALGSYDTGWLKQAAANRAKELRGRFELLEKEMERINDELETIESEFGV